MIAAMLCALQALLFGCAGWAGALVAERVCAGREPYEDGPATVVVGAWPFAAIASAVGLAIALHGADVPHLAELAVVTFALSGCAAADLRCGIVPDMFSLGALALVVGCGAIAHDAVPAIGAAILFVPFAFAAILTKGRGMGWGDVKLAALGGALLGIADAAFAFALAALFAYAVARFTGRLRRAVAFGPYLAASIAATLALVRTP